MSFITNQINISQAIIDANAFCLYINMIAAMLSIQLLLDNLFQNLSNVNQIINIYISKFLSSKFIIIISIYSMDNSIMTNTINKEDFIIIEETFDAQKDICLICTSLITYPIQCIKCKTNFCNKCAKQWLQTSNKCPKKCSSPWIIQFIFPKQILLRCPYSEKCNTIIYSQTFEYHLGKCDYAPQIIKNRQKLKNQFLCNKFHKLMEYNNISQSTKKCIQCEVNCKPTFQCKQCQTFYCNECRYPPLIKIICPLKKHRYVLKKLITSSFLCLKCGICITQEKNECYFDSNCNIMICKDCYPLLPKPTNKQIEQVLFSNKS